MPSFDSATDILDLASAFRQSRVLLSAFDLGVFTVLGQGAAASAVVAKAIPADARATDRLLNALAAIGLVEKTDGLFANTPAAARWLDGASPECLTSLGHASHLFTAWAGLTGAVRAGTTVRDRKRDGFDTAAFIEAMDRRARGIADALVAQIDLEGVERVLDVGGGSGAFAAAFCRARDGLVATVLDLPEVTQLTARYVAAAGFGGRVLLLPGDFHETPFGEGFDIVFFSAIVHMNGADANRRLMAKAFAALAPGGRIVIQDHIMDETRTRPADGALFALNMLINTEAGDTYTENEMRGWLLDAGCQRVEQAGESPRIALMIGHKVA